jgi:hypothetical protein
VIIEVDEIVPKRLTKNQPGNGDKGEASEQDKPREGVLS